MFSPLLKELMDALRVLPGVGPKSAARMALALLERKRPQGQRLGMLLQKAMQEIGRCEKCHVWSEVPVCSLCANPKRDEKRLCVVTSPQDVLALESAYAHRGHYFVLAGTLSPIDGRGPEEIGVGPLLARIDEGTVEEVILAINPTAEGEATTYYLAELLKTRALQVFRIGYGVPLGGELEFVDGNTLQKAMDEMKAM